MNMIKSIRMRITITFSGAAVVGATMIAAMYWSVTTITSDQLRPVAIPLLILLFLSGLVQMIIDEKFLKPLFSVIKKEEEAASLTDEEWISAARVTLNFPLRGAFSSFLIWVTVTALTAFALFPDTVTLRQKLYLFTIATISGAVVFIINFFTFKKIFIRPKKLIIEQARAGFETMVNFRFFSIGSKLTISFVAMMFFVPLFIGLTGYAKVSDIFTHGTIEKATNELTVMTREINKGTPKLDNLRAYLASYRPITGGSTLIFAPDGTNLTPGIGKSKIEIAGNSAVYQDVESYDIYVYMPVQTGDGTTYYVALYYKWKNFESQLTGYVKIIIISIIAIILLALYVVSLVSFDVANPVKIMSRQLRSISQGNLKKNVHLLSDDEVGRLSSSLRESIGNLRSMIVKVDESSKSLSAITETLTSDSEALFSGSKNQVSAVDDVNASITKINASMAEIVEQSTVLYETSQDNASSATELNFTMKNISDNVKTLTNLVDDTNRAIVEMSSSIKHVSSNVKELEERTDASASSVQEIQSSIAAVDEKTTQTKELSEKMFANAGAGADAVSATRNGIVGIQDSTHRTVGVLKSLSTKVIEINKILKMIDEVAEDTNLLALNASIEAAKAGEYGRSFSVVANEIRDLAERTSGNTQDIASIINEIHEETHKAEESMAESIVKVDEGKKLSDEAELALKKIVEDSTGALTMVSEISKATDEQTTATREVAKTMAVVAEMVHGIEKAMNEQERSSNKIKSSSEQMNELTLRVNNTIYEQTETTNRISSSMNTVRFMAEQMDTSAKDLGVTIKRVTEHVEKIKHITDGNLDLSKGLGDVVKELKTRSRTMSTEVSKFEL